MECSSEDFKLEMPIQKGLTISYLIYSITLKIK